jgi:uncharacterized protein (DUF1330 family)
MSALLPKARGCPLSAKSGHSPLFNDLVGESRDLREQKPHTFSPLELFFLQGYGHVTTSSAPNGRPQGAATMTVYVIADIKVTDDKWVPAYAASVHDLVHKHGGKYLARSGNVKTLEGKPLDTTLIALLEFPSEEAVKAFATDPDYAPHAVARQRGSESRLQMIDDTDLAGTIPYLRKG